MRKSAQIAKRKVHQAALARRHGSEGIRHAALAHAIGGNVGRQAELLLAGRAKVLAVEDDLVVLVGPQTQHLQSDMFEGAQQFAAALQHQRAVGAGEFDLDGGLVEVMVARGGSTMIL